MLPRRKSILFVSITLVLAVGGYFYFNRGPSFELTGDEQMTLYSLDPKPNRSVFPGPDDERFLSYKSLGSVEVADLKTRKEIADSLRSSIRPFGGDTCFFPRHAIVVRQNGLTRDFVICFECEQIAVESNGSRNQCRITADPKPLLNKILTDAGIKLAPERAEK